jgi:hypothetical protein
MFDTASVCWLSRAGIWREPEDATGWAMEDEREQRQRIGKCGEICFGYKRNGNVEKACCRQSRLRLMSIRRSRNKRIESLDSSLGDIRTSRVYNLI